MRPCATCSIRSSQSSARGRRTPAWASPSRSPSSTVPRPRSAPSCRTAVKQVVVTSIGEMLGWKGPLIDFVLRHVKKMIPRWRLPGSMRLSEALAEGRRRNLEHVPITHQDIAFLQYTGGTTGVAKGAMLLHRNIIANLLQAGAWVKPFLGDERHVILTPLPLYHIFS